MFVEIFWCDVAVASENMIAVKCLEEGVGSNALYCAYDVGDSSSNDSQSNETV